MVDNSGRITSFDEAHYDQLITYLTAVDNGINQGSFALGPSANLKLDSTISSKFHPGSDSWAKAKQFLAQAGVFAASVHQSYTDTETEVRTFNRALKNAKDVFHHVGSLTEYQAGPYEQEYPDVAGNHQPT